MSGDRAGRYDDGNLLCADNEAGASLPFPKEVEQVV